MKGELFLNSTKDFTVGCNYWASNAGVYMWRDWDEKTVVEDLKLLAKTGVKTLRVFPLWCDFQPIEKCVGSERIEMRIKDKPLDNSPEGIAGVDPIMMDRFERFALLAAREGINLLVCLINGWMSGRMFFPPAFYNKNPIVDKTAVKWEIRFVKYFVNRFKHLDNIIAWEAGNETNVLCWVEKEKCTRDEYWVWLNNIVSTIKSVDNTRPVVAGIHGVGLDNFITPTDVAEICDIMTVHPYPAFVPHCFNDGIDSMKSRLHAAAESVYYSDIGGKPCLCEEIGTLGDMLGDNETAAQYLKTVANSLWAHGSTGVMWWCAHDQSELDFPPYDWCGLERELGLIKNDRTYKPVAEVYSELQGFIKKGIDIPQRKRDAVCILTRDQDNWAVAYSSFVMAVQAGITLSFADADSEIPKANIYMLPSLCGEAMPRRTQNELLRRVYEDGAILYLSWNGAFISDIEKLTGLKVKSNKKRTAKALVELDGTILPLWGERRLETVPSDARLLACEEDGNPVLAVKNHGKGKIYSLLLAPEKYLCDETDAFDIPYYKLYEYIFKSYIDSVVNKKSSPYLGVTEHFSQNGECYLTAINYSKTDDEFYIILQNGKVLEDVLHGEALFKEGKIIFNLPQGEMSIIKIKGA